MFSIKFFQPKQKAAPFSKEQYDYIISDLLERKHAAMACTEADHETFCNGKVNDTDKVFARLIDSIWKEQYSYYKR